MPRFFLRSDRPTCLHIAFAPGSPSADPCPGVDLPPRAMPYLYGSPYYSSYAYPYSYGAYSYPYSSYSYGYSYPYSYGYGYGYPYSRYYW